MTKWAWLCAAVLLGWGTVGAQAQAALYFNPIVTRASNSQVDPGNFAFLGAGNTSALRGGVSIGGSYMFPPKTRLAFGLDMRDEWQGGNDSLLNSFLVGVRVAGRVGERFKPYLQISGGAGTTRAPLTVVRTTKGMAKVYLGGDYALTRHLDFRVVEIGFGTLSTVSTAQYNSSLSYSADRLISFSSGLVYRFGK